MKPLLSIVAVLTLGLFASTSHAQCLGGLIQQPAFVGFQQQSLIVAQPQFVGVQPAFGFAGVGLIQPGFGFAGSGFGGSAVVVNNGGLFGRSNVVAVNGGLGGNSIVVQNGGLFGRRSTIAIAGGGGALVVRTRR